MLELRIEMADNQQLSRHKIKTFSSQILTQVTNTDPVLHLYTVVAFRFEVIQVQDGDKTAFGANV